VVQNVEDQVTRDPQLKARNFFEEIEHMEKGRVVANGVPLGLTRTPGSSGRTGAAVGQDNEEILTGLLGLTHEEINDYIASGAVEAAR
jgi:crotonobetainyl-CoA:carnitine CoA-transferase CaiB-like acyl-CoA transferase